MLAISLFFFLKLYTVAYYNNDKGGTNMSMFRGVKATVYGEFPDDFKPPKEFQGQWEEENGCIECPFYDSIYSEKVEMCNLLNNDEGKCPIYDDWQERWGD